MCYPGAINFFAMSITLKVFFCIFLFFLVSEIDGAHFGYEHPEEWSIDYPTCGGSRQSPINIVSGEILLLEEPTDLQWKGYETIPKSMTLKNNGHSVEISPTWNDDKIPCISGGVLNGEYAFGGLHFHWGAQDDVGSEHTINNCAVPLEMHMVHYKKDYGSISEALKHEDGLVVVGLLFELGKSNVAIMNMQSYANDVKTEGSKVEINPFPLSTFEVNFGSNYFAYLGSLTTPPCSEIVTWIVSGSPRFVSSEQMDFFRSIELSNGDDHNYRPTMPLNGRLVYYI